MNKIKILLSSVAAVALIAGAFAVNARVNNVIFTHGPNDPAGKCATKLRDHATLLTTTVGTPLYTTIQGQPCVPGTVVPVAID